MPTSINSTVQAPSGLKQFDVTFNTRLAARDEDGAYDELLVYLGDCVRNGDVCAFNFVEAEGVELSESAKTRPMATVGWTPDDVLTLAPKMTSEAAAEWLEANAKHIQERMTEMGWGVISELLAYDSIDTADVEEDSDGSTSTE